MGYTLEAVIADAALIREATVDLPRAQRFGLLQGLALVPLTDALHDSGPLGERPFREFHLLPAWLSRWATEWSRGGPLAYVEIDSFGGAMTQAAAVWEHGELTLGPLRVGADEPAPADGFLLSRTLRRLGVIVGPHDRDEFTAVGLGAHRHTEDWAEHASD
ncbi:hypothetical protein ACWGSK_03625 [Nocardiopsis sp. NPDC055551]|uniref:hypothetical protein n=1 Tax=Nocardiopsis sp. NPDC006832 TaxID=3157188 RepID=UPI00340D06A6